MAMGALKMEELKMQEQIIERQMQPQTFDLSPGA